MSKRLSALFGCAITVGEVRGMFRDLGYVESGQGWLVSDLRPLMLAVMDPRRPIFRTGVRNGPPSLN
jgi:hypothetical protein